MQSSCFATDEAPWCVWDWNLAELTETFLETFDPAYFDYVVSQHEQQLDSADAHHAATAIRTTYCHAMETMFALLGAVVQAPDCVPGWILKYRQGQLEAVVEKISRRAFVYSKIRGGEITWESLAGFMLRYFSLSDKERERRVKEGFGRLWARLAGEFSDQRLRTEYNSIKHGFRVKSGGSWISVGVEETPGLSCAPDKMQLVGGSKFGTSFFEPEVLDKRNIRLRRRAVNWDPVTLAGRVRLISMSLRNIVSCLKITYGVPPQSVQFQSPHDLGDFDLVWQGPSLRDSCFSTIIEPKDIAAKFDAEILRVYEADAAGGQ